MKTGSLWTWSDGTLWDYDNWCNSGENCGQQPSGDGDCVDLGYHNLNTWNDGSCNADYSFICQTTTTITTTTTTTANVESGESKESNSGEDNEGGLSVEDLEGGFISEVQCGEEREEELGKK